MSHNAFMNDSPPQDPRRRLRELLAIPERDRSDAQWDEIIELEITLAPGNRESERPFDRQPERPMDKRQGSAGPGRRPDQRKTGPRPAGPSRPDPRPPAARPETASDTPPDGRVTKRHTRRPRRPPDVSGGES